ncbi:Tn3 family transposase [Streptomyces naganishii]|uniref:Tn3 family transposase n=1 Tax=Streptomyces naganishii TaxID=285447 RepID=UPI0036A086FF
MTSTCRPSRLRHLMRVAVSVREGAISSTLPLRRLRAGSRKNATYTAFREVGRVIRTVQLPADGEELGDGVLAGGVLLDEVGPASPAGLAACSCNNYRYD